MERAVHPPPELMMPGRDPASTVMQAPQMHPNGHTQFPAGPESVRNGLISPRDGVFSDTPLGSTRSVSPDTPQATRKRGRRPKSKTDADIVGTVPMMSPPSTFGPGPGPESLADQQLQARKRGRKPKMELDQEADRKDAVHRTWNVVTPDSHQNSFGHGDTVMDDLKQDPASFPSADSANQQGYSDISRNGHRTESGPGYPSKGSDGRPMQDVPPHERSFMADDAASRSDPRYERQHPGFDDMSNRLPGNFTPGSVEEFEHHQRFLRQQQEQQLHYQQQHDQHRQQHPNPQVPASHETVRVHTHPMEPNSGHPPSEHERRGMVAGHGQVGAQSAVPSGKEPETVHRLETDVANALVNIQHENRFQSPDSASYPENDLNKRARLESSLQPMEPHGAPSHHRPTMEPVALDRQDLAQDEQETAIILQSMMNNRQAMEQGDQTLLHHGQALHESQHSEYANGFAPRQSSPQVRASSQHREPLQQQPPRRGHLQQDERPPVDPHQYERRLQEPQLQSTHQPYGHSQGYPPSDSVPFDPHLGPVREDHPSRQRHSSLGGTTQTLHPSQNGPEIYREHGGENHGNYHHSTPYSTDRDASSLPRSSNNSNAPYTPNPVQQNDHWRTGSPARGRNDMADPAYSGQQRDVPMDQQHPHHYPQPQQPHPHAAPQGPWSDDRADSRVPPSHSYGELNAQSVGQEHGTVAVANPVKAKVRGKGKSKVAGMMSPETERPDTTMSEPTLPTHESDYDPRTQQHAPLDHDMPLHSSQAGATVNGRGPYQARLQPTDVLPHIDQEMSTRTVESGGRGRQEKEPKQEESSGPRPVNPGEGRSTQGPSRSTTIKGGLPDRPVPKSLLFGSGMILVKKLPDTSGHGTSSGSEGSTKFPPSQLSIKTGFDLSKATGPPPLTFSPLTPLSAVATALAVKKKRSKLTDGKDEVVASSSGTVPGKGDPLPPPPPPAKGKGGNRGRKGVVLVGSTDADIERSNQITRSGGPAWLIEASNSMNGGTSTGTLLATNITVITPTSATPTTASAPATIATPSVEAPVIRRRAPLSPSTLLIENDKRKPKRIKIDDMDVRQVQRTSSTLTDATDNDRKDISGKVGEDDEMGDGDMEGSGSDGCSNGMGSQRRRLPEEDDEDLGDEEVGRGTVSNRSNASRQGQGQSQGHKQPQSQEQGSQALSQAAGGKTMKRRSTSNLSGTQLSKRAKEKSKAVDSDVEPLKTNGKAMGIPLKRTLSKGGSAGATPTGDTDAESDLAMEDDIKCPHIFGLGDSDSEHEGEEDALEDDIANDDDDDGKSTVSTPGKVNGSSDQAGSSSGSSKVEGALDPEDPVQLQGRKWVKTLGMPEKAWEETFKTYERVKRLKELKNRQPVRKRDAILAAILYIVCRDEGSPRTFSEICTASSVKRGDIGAYYRLMLKVLKPSKTFTASARDTDAEAFMTRWCESLSLPAQFTKASIHVFSMANTLNLTSGKCPSSVGAASIYMCIFSWNNARRSARCKRYHCPGCQGLNSTEHPGADQDGGWIRKDQKDVAVAVGVVTATLMGCFRNLAPESERLVPADFLASAEEGV
ncbi:Transcription initiation factor IIB [Mortierella sp. AD031]|nr:Transcription initiation factor IIB [Mortierella sp. AD031]